MFVPLWHNNKKDQQKKHPDSCHAPRPHTYKTTCAFGMFCSGFKCGILSSSHFQIKLWDVKVSWPLWMVTWLWGGVTLIVFFWRETDWQSVLVTFLVNLWLGCVGGESELSTETYKILFHFFYWSYYWIVLHTYPPSYTMLFKWYNPMNEHINCLTLAIPKLHFQTIIIEGGWLK